MKKKNWYLLPTSSGSENKKPMQSLKKKHRIKDSYIGKYHLLILQSNFFLLTGNLKE